MPHPPTAPNSTQHPVELEDKIEEIAALLTQWYTLHLLTTFQPPHITIAQPPHSPSASVLATWKTAGISDLVIEVLKHIPYLSGEGRRDLAPDTRVVNYVEDDGGEEEAGMAVEVWKDVMGVGEEGYLGDFIPLTHCVGVSGYMLIYDIGTNEIFELRNHTFPAPAPPQNTQLPSPYFRHHPHAPAPQILRKWINKIKSLHWVPDLDIGVWMTRDSDVEDNGKYDAIKLLYLECGWPDHFDKDVFEEKYFLLSRSRDWD